MVLGKPCNLIICSKYVCATVAAEKGCAKGRKCAYLLNLSTTIKMESLPLDFGRPSMKSMEMSSQIALGMGRGCNKPAGGDKSGLFLWQTAQALT